MNNLELIKLIAQYVHAEHKLPKGIKGYEKSLVQGAIEDMISKKVIFEGEVKAAPWGADPTNRTKQYRRMSYYINKELMKTEFENMDSE